jgi:GTP-sensing pleiotropic transcriptional regulator CodY
MIDDKNLDLTFTSVVSAVREVIDSSGYSIDLELGILGATVEQRISRVI